MQKTESSCLEGQASSVHSLGTFVAGGGKGVGSG